MLCRLLFNFDPQRKCNDHVRVIRNWVASCYNTHKCLTQLTVSWQQVFEPDMLSSFSASLIFIPLLLSLFFSVRVFWSVYSLWYIHNLVLLFLYRMWAVHWGMHVAPQILLFFLRVQNSLVMSLLVLSMEKLKGPIHNQFYCQYMQHCTSYWSCMGNIDVKIFCTSIDINNIVSIKLIVYGLL